MRRRVRCPGRWEFRYWTIDSEGQRKLKSLFIGTTDEYANESAVRARAGELLARIDHASVRMGSATVSTLIARFIQEERLLEIRAGTHVSSGALHYSTAGAYLSIINKHLRPRWGIANSMRFAQSRYTNG